MLTISEMLDRNNREVRAQRRRQRIADALCYVCLGLTGSLFAAFVLALVSGW